MKIKETMVIFPEKVRTVCIENEWYTRGSNEAYGNMLESCYNRKRVTTNFLYEIACDIFIHSVMDTDYSINDNIANIMFVLKNNCVKTCFEIID